MGNFHDIIMLFGFKTARANFLELMTAMFHDMLCIFLKDFVDDIMANSKEFLHHVDSLRRVVKSCIK